MKRDRIRKNRIIILTWVLCMLMTFAAAAEGLDINAYSYEELVSLRDSMNERIAEMERQYAIENGNREISFEQSELLVFKGETVKLTPSVRRIV